MKKKLISLLFCLLFCLLFFTGCTSSKSFTYVVETGDRIKVELDTSDGYNLKSQLPFTISKDGQTLSQGSFITLDGYDQYKNAVNTDIGATIIEESKKNNIEYIFYSYEDKEYNYVIKIVDSNTGLLLGNNVSKESAEEVFKRLTFSED